LTAPLPAAHRSPPPTAESLPPAPELSQSRPPAALSAIPAMPAPVETFATDTGAVNQKSGNAPGRERAEISEPGDNGKQTPVNQPLFIEARPLYLKNPPPDYPSTARRRHQQGVVLLEVLVSEQGRATAIEIFTSSGYESLDNAALTAVRQWLFEPARQGEQRVAMRVRVPVRFALE